MSIRINWENPNAKFDKVKIYRSDTKFTKNSLPAVLTELPTGTTYLDTTTKTDKLYWYAIGVVSGADEVISLLSPAIQLTSVGFGPTELLRGNNEFGYFGVVPNGFFTGLEVCLGLGISVDPGAVVWYKFIHNGKILYHPNKPLSIAQTWNSIYARGGVFGMDNTGVGAHGQTPANQKKIITKGDDDYLIRLPKLTTRPDYTPPSNDLNYVPLTHNDVFGSEWVQGICSLFGVSIGVINGKLHPFDELSPVASDWPTTAPGLWTMCAEYGPTYCMALSGVAAPYSGSSNSNRAAAMAWRPVLELAIPDRA